MPVDWCVGIFNEIFDGCRGLAIVFDGCQGLGILIIGSHGQVQGLAGVAPGCEEPKRAAIWHAWGREPVCDSPAMWRRLLF